MSPVIHARLSRRDSRKSHKVSETKLPSKKSLALDSLMCHLWIHHTSECRSILYVSIIQGEFAFRSLLSFFTSYVRLSGCIFVNSLIDPIDPYFKQCTLNKPSRYINTNCHTFSQISHHTRKKLSYILIYPECLLSKLWGKKEKEEKKMFVSIKVTCTQKFKRHKNMVIF